MTFLLFGVFALVGFVFIILVVPETKGKSLEELEALLVKSVHKFMRLFHTP